MELRWGMFGGLIPRQADGSLGLCFCLRLSLSLSLGAKLRDHTNVERLYLWFKAVETGVGDGEAAVGDERIRFERLQEAAAGRAAANNAD
jgi:hypothetical protein